MSSSTPRRSTRRSSSRASSVEVTQASRNARSGLDVISAESSPAPARELLATGSPGVQGGRPRRTSSRSVTPRSSTKEDEQPVTGEQSQQLKRRKRNGSSMLSPGIEEERDEEDELQLEAELTVVESSTGDAAEDITPLQTEQEQGSPEPTQSKAKPGRPDPTLRRYLLRRKVIAAIGSLGPVVRPLLIIAAFGLLLLLPSPVPPYSRNTYVDENALQPGAANAHWSWPQVGLCDAISRDVAQFDPSSTNAEERAHYLSQKLTDFGLKPSTQAYSFQLRTGDNVSGVNTYSRWRSGRSDGREAVVIAASWLSAWKGQDDPDHEGDGQGQAVAGRRTNVRGISTALGLAKFLTAQMHWSKDIIFVFSDGYLDGMQAWSNAYFGHSQANLEAESLDCTGAVIWNGIAIDYPSDSFSELVVLHEGKDGQLPNMDVLNTLVKIAEDVGRVPVRLPGSEEVYRAGRDDESGGGWGQLGKLVERHLGWGWRGVARYRKGAANLLSQMQYQSVGHPTGLHGLFQRFHVDAVTIFAVPAKGPHGFYDMGRILESQVKSYSNLIERLHHSQFFYLLTSPKKFVQLGVYLPVALLLSVALTLAGIAKWTEEGRRAQRRRQMFVEAQQRLTDTGEAHREDPQLEVCTLLDYRMDLAISVTKATCDGFTQEGSQSADSATSKRRQLLHALSVLDAQGRPVGTALALTVCGHLLPLAASVFGSTRLDEWTATWDAASVLQLLAVCGATVWSQHLAPASPLRAGGRPLAHLMHAFAMLHAGLGIAVLSLLNFSAALAVGALLTVPLYLLPIPNSEVTLHLAQHRSEDEGDTVEVSTNPVRLPWSKRVTRLDQIRALAATVFLFAILPWNACRISEYLVRLAASDRADGLPALKQAVMSLCGSDLACVQDAIEAAFFDHEVLQTNFVPIATFFYTPVVLEAITACVIIVLRM
ncbi:unnamed protein product [Parajaminaea phylloscopi]